MNKLSSNQCEGNVEWMECYCRRFQAHVRSVGWEGHCFPEEVWSKGTSTVTPSAFPHTTENPLVPLMGCEHMQFSNGHNPTSPIQL